jgi:subtilisin family serine protease
MMSHRVPIRRLIFRTLLFVAGVVLLTTPAPLLAQDDPALPAADPAVDAWPGEYIVVIDPTAGAVTAAQAHLAQAGELVEQATACGSTNVLQVWRLDDFAAAQQMLAGDPAVLAIEPNWIVRAASLPTPPPTTPETPFPFTDTYYTSRQWNLQRSDAARAWQLIADHDLPQQTVRVAVIDSGVDFSHPDLAGRLLNGINYITPSSLPNDDFGHGTHVTGIIAALANNGKGIVGGTSHVEIDPLKMLGSTGSGTIANLNLAICDAADRGADVINMSLEVPSSLSTALADEMQAAVDYAYNRGSVIVAAAGNSNGGPVYYPARLNHVIAVAALTPELMRASYSAIGTQLDIAAGGGSFTENVLSTWPSSVPGKCTGTGRVLLTENGAYYCTEPGTSMAAPLVSAAAALLRSLQPSLTSDQVEAILVETARNIGLPSIHAGAGLLDMAAAVRRTLITNVVISPGSISATVPSGAAPFTQTVVFETSSLINANVTGVVSQANWFEITNMTGSSFAASVRYGQPIYLTFVISPTHLLTGVYSSAVPFNIAYADGREDAISLPITIEVVPNSTFASASNLASQVFLPLVTNKSVHTTILEISNSGWVTVPLPFAFPLSGIDIASTTAYTEMYVYADGFVAFSGEGHIPLPTPGITQCLPILSQPVQGIFGWWADLDPSLGGEVSVSWPDTDRFVIQYKDIPTAGSVTPPYTVTFQIVLYANGDVGLNYLDTPDAVATSLTSLTPRVVVGAQAQAGLFRNQAACITTTHGYGRPPHDAESILIKREEIF